MDFKYSPEAFNCIPFFDKSAKTIRVEVEGVEDIPFWDSVFSNMDCKGYKIICESQQGCKEIIKHIKNTGEKQEFIAILDSEYDKIINDKSEYQSPFVIFTLRHSTENYLFCANSLNLLIRKLNRNTQIDNLKDCIDYQTELCKRLEKLIYYDCKKAESPHLFRSGLKIAGSKSNIATLTENNSYLPKIEKINSFIQENNLNDIDIKDIKEKFKNKNLFHFTNGHFITFSIFTFINSKTKIRPKMGKDTLYAYLYDYCAHCKQQCPDYQNITKQAQNALDALFSVIER